MLAASVNAAIGKAGLMLMLGGATFGIIAVLYGIRSRNLQRQSMRYAWLSFVGAVLAVVLVQRALITRGFSMAYVQQVETALNEVSSRSVSAER